MRQRSCDFMSGMALTHTAPPRAVALASAAAAAGVALAGAGPLAPATASAAAVQPGTPHAATSTLLTLTTNSVPALSVPAFQGSYATTGLAQNGGDTAADATHDPDAVLERITLDQPAQSKTHSDAGKNWADAQTAVEYSLHGKKLYSIAAVEARAECTSSPLAATTYVHTDPESVNVLGTGVTIGKTTIPVTGAQLGVAAVDHGSLSVTYTRAAAQEEQTATITARAHLDLSISGTFYDSKGKQLYSGPLQNLRIADVQATCQASPTAPPSPTTAPPSTPGSRSANPASSPAQGPAQPSTLKGAPIPAALNAPAPHHVNHAVDQRSGADNQPGTPENGPMQPAQNTARTTPESSNASLWWAVLSVLGLGGGVGLYLATRRRGQHQ
jgi:hypothetical protein